MCAVEQVVPEHIQHRNHANHGAKQIWPLRHCGPDQQPGIGATKDSQFPWFGPPSLNKPLCSDQEVIECDLAMSSLGSPVPLGAEFRAATNVGQRKEATSFDEKCHKDTELWCHRYTVSAVGRHDHR